MNRSLIVQPIIRRDKAGDGRFGAPRGIRSHKGIDYLCEPETFCYSPAAGVITKLGFPYADDEKWRYVEVTDDRGQRHRMFYVYPLVRVDQFVHIGEVVGETQDISGRYPNQGMSAHVHYEVINSEGQYVNPESLT